MKTIYLFVVAGMMLIAAAPLRAAVSDKSINNKIFHLLMTHRSLAKGSGKMIATTHDGNVTLSGNVVTPADKENLRDAIAGVSGVQHVNDRELTPMSNPSSRFGEGLRN